MSNMCKECAKTLEQDTTVQLVRRIYREVYPEVAVTVFTSHRTVMLIVSLPGVGCITIGHDGRIVAV